MVNSALNKHIAIFKEGVAKKAAIEKAKKAAAEKQKAEKAAKEAAEKKAKEAAADDDAQTMEVTAEEAALIEA